MFAKHVSDQGFVSQTGPPFLAFTSESAAAGVMGLSGLVEPDYPEQTGG